MKKVVLRKDAVDPRAIGDYLGMYLQNLGIAPGDVDYFIHPERYNIRWDGTTGDNPESIPNMAGAVQLVQTYATDPRTKFFIQVDSDVDGFTSAAIIYNYLHRRFPGITINYRLHEGKQHGIIPETIPEGTDFVIVPDAGSMQIEELTELSNRGMVVVVLDHHEYDELTSIPNVIIVNSQNSHCPNHGLSGAGVAFMFAKEFDEKFYPLDPIADNFVDLAALGIISDVMDSRIVGNHFIIYQGLHSIRNKMFRELLTKQSFKIHDPTNPTKIDIAFYIAPLINGLIRSGSQEEKELFFSAMLDTASTEDIQSMSRGQVRVESIWQQAARLAANAKSRQDAAKKKMMAMLEKKIINEGIDKHKIIIVALNEKESEAMNPNIVGLAAMDVAKNFNRPTLVLRYLKEEDGSIHYSGSGRSNNYPEFPSLKAFLESSNLCDFVAGHANAFGASVSQENLQSLIDFADNNITANFDDHIVEVDYYFKGLLNTELLNSFASANFLWGNMIVEPVFAFDFDIKDSDVIIMGANGASLKIRRNNIDFVMFNATEVIQQLQSRPISSVTIIGTPAINEWMGKRTVQVRITDIVVTERKVSILNDLI